MEKVMAYSPHTTNLPRRALVRFLGWIGASTIIGAAGGVELSPAPEGLEDAQLFARWSDYLKIEVELNRVEEGRDVISWNARQAYPPKPRLH